MYIVCRFDEVSAIRWPKMMTFSITGSQIFFANFVIFARNKRKTAYRFIVDNAMLYRRFVFGPVQRWLLVTASCIIC